MTERQAERQIPEIIHVHGRDADQARGVVVVIDVLRAFTVSAYALAGGARELLLVRTVEEAVALRAGRYPNAILAGEVEGRLIPGFDLNNSPVMMQSADVRGRRVIQRTGAGTQGAVNARHATRLLVGSLVTARATAAYAAQLARELGAPITLVPTADPTLEMREAIEDEVCAAYLEALLQTRADAETILTNGISQLEANERLGVWSQGLDDFPAGDVPAALAANRFPFAMEGQRQTVAGIEHIVVHRVTIG